MSSPRRWTPAAFAALAWQLADPLAIFGFVLLAALGRLPAQDVVYAVLAVLAGRLTPRGPTLPPSSGGAAVAPSSGPSSRRGPPAALLSVACLVRDGVVHLVELARGRAAEPGPLSHRPAHS